MSSAIKQLIPKPIKARLRNAYYTTADTIDMLLGRRDALTPPRKMILSIGGGNFEVIGKEFFRYFVDFGGLKPGDRVLDVGCGNGRMAAPLTKYLTADGSYEGFDIMADAIAWCEKRITPKYANFRFRRADIYNSEYNPEGTFQASAYQFPYLDRSFDFVLLTSVFTHLLPRDMEHYLSEIARVLKVGGRCFITFFLLNAESRQLTQAKADRLSFEFEGESKECRINDPKCPEAAVAFDEGFIRGLYDNYGFTVIEPIRYGSWCGRQNFTSFQDIVIGNKRELIK